MRALIGIAFASFLTSALLKLVAESDCFNADCNTPQHEALNVFFWLSLALLVLLLLWNAMVELLRRRR